MPATSSEGFFDSLRQDQHRRYPCQEQDPKNKNQSRFQDVNLEAAIVNAMYAAVIESEFDHAQVAEALGSVTEGGETASAMANSILTAMAEYHSAGTVLR
uniref:Uncharacterized protein n=1 Tax=Candidatus Kentrum sp. LPFa TaxID=2126335 RepID=A0A450WVH5_9GAMM|nr:MAG: hypothetical protein BECKLPF1236B_GA0070989_12362 [Candidatus Kentron sp. LPFa]